MATGGEPASAGNIKAFYEMLKNGGVSEGFIKDLKALRKAMGLGDTLGKVPMDCLDVAFTDSVDDSTIGQQLAVTPKGVYEYMMHKEGGSAALSLSSRAYEIDKSGATIPIVLSKQMCDGASVSADASKFSVATAGFYEVKCSLTLQADTSGSNGRYCRALARINVNGMSVLSGDEVEMNELGFFTMSVGGEVFATANATISVSGMARATTSSTFGISKATGTILVKRI